MQPEQGNWSKMSSESYEETEKCLKTNYYGAKAMVEELLPLLQSSDSPRIVNISSYYGLLQVYIHVYIYISILMDTYRFGYWLEKSFQNGRQQYHNKQRYHDLYVK